MACKKRHNPGTPCCTAEECAETCIDVNACGAPAEGAAVSIYACADPGTILASGTADADGLFCSDLSAHVGTSLCVSVTLDGYRTLTDVLLGNFCGRTYTYALAPGGDSTGTPGTVLVTLTNCAGTAVSGATVQVRNAGTLASVASGTTDGAGLVTFTGLSTGVSYDLRVTSSSLIWTFAAWSLTTSNCEADITVRIDPPNFPDPCPTPQTVTPASCSDGEPRTCCAACAPATLARTLVADVPVWGLCDAGPSNPDATAGAMTTVTGGEVTLAGNSLGGALWTGEGAVVECCANPSFANCFTYPRLRLECTGGDLWLSVNIWFYKTNEWPIEYIIPPWPTPPCRYRPAAGYKLASWYVPAASLTCSPFAATFTLPDLDIDLGGCNTCNNFDCPNYYTITVPGQTITITE